MEEIEEKYEPFFHTNLCSLQHLTTLPVEQQLAHLSRKVDYTDQSGAQDRTIDRFFPGEPRCVPHNENSNLCVPH